RLGAGQPAARHAHRRRERRRAHRDLHPVGEHGATGRDHPGAHRARLGSRRTGGELTGVPRPVPSQRRKSDMTATTTDSPTEQAGTPGVGRIARVTGPVIDVEFAPDEIPAIYNALVASVDKSTIGQGEGTLEMTFEVNQHLGDNLVRAVALKPTD